MSVQLYTTFWSFSQNDHKSSTFTKKIAEKGEGYENKEITYFAGSFGIKSTAEVINIKNQSKKSQQKNCV